MISCLMSNTPRLRSGANSAEINHCNRETPKRQLANSTDTDEMPENAASEQGLHCLQIVQAILLVGISKSHSLKYLQSKLDSSNI